MPTKPKIVNLNPDVSKMLNAIRTNASQTYQDRIPVATQENIREVGNEILQFYATQNEFLNALVNRIARVLITSKMYSNPLKKFKKGTMEYGETIEEVFVNIANAQQFDPEVAEKEVFKREIPDVNAVFHRRNYENFFKVTISEQQLRAAFLSQQGILDLIARIVDSLYSGSEFDEFLIMKQLIADAATEGRMYPVKVPVPSAASAKEIVTKIKAYSNMLEFMSSNYNPYGVLTVSKKNEQILIIDAEFDAMIDVEVLASAFNMSKAEFMGKRVLIDNFANLTGVVAALVDESFFMVFDNLIEFTEQYNAQGLYWNYFLHVWKTFSTSPFAPAILFLTTDIAVTGVTVTPAVATVHKGSNIVLTANVAGTGYPPSDVTWTITGNTSNKTYISPYGVLYIGEDETADTITVTATSDYDKSKNGTSTITVE